MTSTAMVSTQDAHGPEQGHTVGARRLQHIRDQSRTNGCSRLGEKVSTDPLMQPFFPPR